MIWWNSKTMSTGMRCRKRKCWWWGERKCGRLCLEWSHRLSEDTDPEGDIWARHCISVPELLRQLGHRPWGHRPRERHLGQMPYHYSWAVEATWPRRASPSHKLFCLLLWVKWSPLLPNPACVYHVYFLVIRLFFFNFSRQASVPYNNWHHHETVVA